MKRKKPAAALLLSVVLLFTILAPASALARHEVSVSIAPASASVLAGTTQQFTATVLNTRNTAVTWSATGGTVTSAGLYTAGSVTGMFSVTATSVADSTKSTSAAVTVTAPVSITVAPTSASLQTGRTQQFSATQNRVIIYLTYHGKMAIFTAWNA